jgi:putative protein-disulfide isomerase
MKKNTLITVYDPLCGWCFGFGPVLLQVEDKYRDRLDFDIISGGMITGTSVGPLSNMATFISQAYPVVEQHTGVKFGPGFLKTLEEGSVTFSSLEPSNVLKVLKELFPAEALQAAHEIQAIIYQEGINPVRYEDYLPLFIRRGVKEEKAMELLKSAETSQATVLDFAQSQQWGIRGFPACLVETADGKLYGISNGFLPFAELENRLLPYLLPAS